MPLTDTRLSCEYALDCIGIDSYEKELFVAIVLPLLLIVVIVLVFAVYNLGVGWQLAGLHSQQHEGRLRAFRSIVSLRGAAKATAFDAMPYVLYLLFLVFPLVSRTAFAAFSCHRFHDGTRDVFYLRADVSIECYSPAHDTVRAVAYVAIALYPIGNTLLFGALLFFARDSIVRNRPTKLSTSIAFLYREYRTAFLFWEVIEMVRRVIFVGVFVAFRQGTVEQLAYATISAVLFLALQMLSAPFKATTDEFMAVMCNLALAVFFITCVFFKYIPSCLLHSTCTQCHMDR